MIKVEVAEILRASVDKLDTNQSMFEMGLDSLMAVELRNRLQEAFVVKLSPVLVFEYPTLEKLSHHLCQLLFPMVETVVEADDAATDAAAALENIAHLSADEVGALLDKELEMFDDLIADGE